MILTKNNILNHCNGTRINGKYVDEHLLLHQLLFDYVQHALTLTHQRTNILIYY